MAGGRNTIQRNLVLETVRNLMHPTADEIYEMISKEHPHISKATVYRNLNLLADKGEIRRLQLMDTAVRFDRCFVGHFHAQCKECGRILDIEMRHQADGMQQLLEGYGFLVEDKEVLFRGLCQSCRERRQNI